MSNSPLNNQSHPSPDGVSLQPPPIQQPSSAKPSLQEDLKRAWDWVVFAGQTLRRLGGPLAILSAFYTVLSILVKRTLVQWGWRKD
jgi:hypothetical protein